MPRPGSSPIVVAVAEDLDRSTIAQAALDDREITLTDGVLTPLRGIRDRALRALRSAPAVYGVNTGMGALSGRRLDAVEQAGHQASLLVARAVGTAPWLTRTEARAVQAVRLRSLLNGDAAVSVEVCRQLAELLNADVVAAIPRTGLGGAGEVIALAHLAGPLIGQGAVLGSGDDPVPAAVALARAGLAPLTLGPKDGVALLQGVPVTTGLSVLRLVEARHLLGQATAVFAAACALTGVTRDPIGPGATRADDVLAAVNAQVHRLAGTPAGTRSLQAPVSFRVSTQVLAHVQRSLTALDDAVDRALRGVTDSPAFVDGAEPRFVGTAGFSGYDLAVHLGNLTVAVVAGAESSATRLHRLMDPAVTGATVQLAADPGPDTGLSLVHKRAVGLAHELRRSATASVLGPIETSAGQEDVQSFSVEAAEALRTAVHGWTQVLACELLALHQLRTLGAAVPADARLPILDRVAELLPWSSADRRWGADLAALHTLLVAR